MERIIIIVQTKAHNKTPNNDIIVLIDVINDVINVIITHKCFS
jgi:hypothetical protein